MSKSSVEWFSNQTYELFEQYSEGNFDRITLNKLVLKATEQAKAMHKEDMIDFGNDLLAQNDINYIGMPNLAEQYYNETYGGNK